MCATCYTPKRQDEEYFGGLREAVLERDGYRLWALLARSAFELSRCLGAAPAPDETTICRFRHLLEKHDLCGMMLDAVNIHLEAKGIKIATGTIVDATILHAPCSTRNASGERDPEMHQTKKGNQWYFGLKAHIGVDANEGTVHTVVTTAANVADCRVLPELLHGEERKVLQPTQSSPKPINSPKPPKHQLNRLPVPRFPRSFLRGDPEEAVFDSGDEYGF